MTIRRSEHRGFTVWELLIVIAIIAILAALAIPKFTEGGHGSSIPRIYSDMRTVTTALETYYLDYGVYPPEMIGSSGHPTLPRQLTTPVSFLTSLPSPRTGKSSGSFDFLPFVGIDKDDFFPIHYATDGRTNFILYHPAQDGEVDIQDIDKLVRMKPSETHQALLPFSYDPTNGTNSRGDIWRVKD